ncbi:voltage-gated potassium channel [Aureococcus anophagefferens]|nr:voltage-gated potassium channel [Aureococcus anophagefferens]
MAVCADEMVACLEETAGLGPNVDQSAVGLSLEADSAALRPVLKKLEGLLARIEERRVRSLRLAEIDGDGVITYGEPEEERYDLSRPGGLAPLLDAPEAARARRPPCASRGPSPAPTAGGSDEWKEEGVPSEEVVAFDHASKSSTPRDAGDTASAPSRDLAVGDRAKIAEELRAKHRPEGMPLLKQISVKTAHAAIGHATLHSARHTEKHGDESKEPARPRTARDAKAPRTHTMMLQSEAGKAAQTTELLFRARCREIFNNIDADHSGEIDLEELGVAMKLLGREMAPEAVKEMMAKFDKDGDGNLDMDEFGNMAKLKKRMVQTDGIAMPDNTFVQIWDIMVLLLILVLFPLLPLMLAFPVISKTMRQFDTYCDIVFVVDIVKNFHVGYVDANDVLHMDRKEIARNYLTGWFWPDVASVISVLKWIDMGDSETFLSILKMVKLFKLFRTARLLDHLAPYWYQVQDYYHFHISDAWIKLCKLFFFLIVLAHWMGCVSYALARFWNFPVVVGRRRGFGREDGANLKTVISQYSWCVCRALGLIVMESYESPYSSGTCVETGGWCTIEAWTILLSLSWAPSSTRR